MIEVSPDDKRFSKAALVQIELYQTENNTLSEFKQLVISAEISPVVFMDVKRDRPDSKCFIGQGKVEELSELVQLHCCNLIIVNADLAATQQRNLEKATGHRVIDRTELILDIFAQRASTYEGKLQVELAQLQHLSTRLVRGWTHLERQKGGIGLRGPGETQLETDRRLLRARVKLIKQRLEKVRSQRHQGRRARKKANVTTVALIGYTNVGKSSLFNLLCDENVYVKNKLFATLDPTLRKLELPGYGLAILADTVGFIRGLPHALIKAFRATLEEVLSADLLLHVVDASDPFKEECCAKVLEVLKEIGAEKLPQLMVYNKIDLLGQDRNKPRIDRDASSLPVKVWVSIEKQWGVSLLQEAIGERLAGGLVYCCLVLKPCEAKLRAWFYAEEAVVHELITNAGEYQLELKISRVKFQKIQLDYLL